MNFSRLKLSVRKPVLRQNRLAENKSNALFDIFQSGISETPQVNELKLLGNQINLFPCKVPI